MTNQSRSIWRFLKPTPTSIMIVLLLAAAIFAWEEWIEDHVVARRFAVVEEDVLYRSGRLTTTTHRRVVTDNNIKTVIDFGGYDSNPELEMAIHKIDKELGVTRHLLPMIGDGTGDPDNYLKAMHILADEKNHPVLMHCAAGSQRTGVGVTLYKMIFKDVPLDEAYPESFAFGHDPRKNWKLPLYLGRWAEEIEREYNSASQRIDTASVDENTSHPE